MTSSTGPGTPILGSLRSADGKGIVHIEHPFETDIADLWSALTDPGRLARWYGQVEGDLRPGGEFRARVLASGWEGTGRVDACEPPRRLLVTSKEADAPYEEVIEATLTADGHQTILILDQRSLPLDQLAATGRDCRYTLRIWPPISLGVSASPRRGGASSCLPIRTWRPISARHWPLLASRDGTTFLSVARFRSSRSVHGGQ